MKPAPFPAVIAEPGETLSHIALRELGRANLWDVIAEANHIGDPRSILPGDIIVVGGNRPLPFKPRHRAF